MKHNHYRHLMIMSALSFVAMYALMYAMVDSFSVGITQEGRKPYSDPLTGTSATR